MPRVFNKHWGDAPSDAVYIGRGSQWGNPFVIGPDGNRSQVIHKYDAMIPESLYGYVRQELAGKDLVCFCSPAPCHGDVLLRIANSL